MPPYRENSRIGLYRESADESMNIGRNGIVWDAGGIDCGVFGRNPMLNILGQRATTIFLVAV